MTDNEITEAYFRARGWKPKTLLGGFMGTPDWLDPQGRLWGGSDTTHALPNILESNSAFIEHVLVPMQNEEYSLEFVDYKKGMGIRWKGGEHMKVYSQLIKDLNIPRAAVIAAMRYWESKK